MSDQFVKFWRRDECFIVRVLVIAIGMPKIRIVFSVVVEHLSEMLNLIVSQNLPEVRVASSTEITKRCDGFLAQFSPWSVSNQQILVPKNTRKEAVTNFDRVVVKVARVLRD